MRAMDPGTSITHRPCLTPDSYPKNPGPYGVMPGWVCRHYFGSSTTQVEGPTAAWSLTGKIAPPGQLVSGKPGFGKPASGTSGAGGAWPPAGGCPTTGIA